MPSRHFTSIRSLHLNAKYIARHTTFTTSLAHFPRSYAEKFKAVGVPNPWYAGSRKSYISTWHAACSVLAGMSSLKNLYVQLCVECFAPVLHVKRPGVQICNEPFVFLPLVEVGRRRDLERFEVEVDWEEGEEEWAGKERGFVLARVPRRVPAERWS